MRNLVLTGAVLLGGLAVAGCHPVQSHSHHATWDGDNHWSWDKGADDRIVTVADKLNCPDEQGDLHRVAMAADGRSCQYHGDEDQDVSLSLLPLGGQAPQAALAPLETGLRALVPARSGASPVNIEAHDGDRDGDGDRDNAKIDLPGLHIDAQGDKAKVRVLGMDINANGDYADIKTNMGMRGTTIHAGPGGAEIRAGDVGQHSANLVFVLAGDNAGPSGYRAVGYIARGPSGGPLVVGEFKSRASHHPGHDRDLQRLIDLNVTSGG